MIKLPSGPWRRLVSNMFWKQYLLLESVSTVLVNFNWTKRHIHLVCQEGLDAIYPSIYPSSHASFHSSIHPSARNSLIWSVLETPSLPDSPEGVPRGVFPLTWHWAFPAIVQMWVKIKVDWIRSTLHLPLLALPQPFLISAPNNCPAGHVVTTSCCENCGFACVGARLEHIRV